MVLEISFENLADRINRNGIRYAHVFTKKEGSLDLENKIIWVDINGQNFRIYVDKCELMING